MSGTNASIPLAYNPQALGPDLGQAIQVGNQFANFQANAQALRGQNAMRALFADPSNLDASGMPNANAMRQIMAVDPDAGMKLMANKQALYNQQLGAKMAALNIGEKQQGMLREINTDAMLTYERAMKDGKSPQQARAAAQSVYSDAYNGAVQSGVFSPDQVAHMSPEFDPERGMLTKGYFDAQKAGFTQQLDVAKLSEQHRHNVAMEEQPKPGVEAERDAQTIAGVQPKIDAGTATPEERQNYDAAVARRDARIGAKGGANAERQTLLAQYKKDNPSTSDADALKAVERDMALAKSGTTPDARHNVAEMIASYQMAPLSGFAMARGPGAEIMAEVKKLNPDYQAARFAEINRAMTNFGIGKQGDTVRALNAATQHIGIMEQAATALKNGDVQTFNSVGNRIAAEFGYPAPTTFDALKQIVGTEIEKAVAGGIGAVADRDRLMAALASANSPTQLANVFKDFKLLMGGQALALRQQYEDSTGFKAGSPFSFDAKLLPETQKQLGIARGETQVGSNPPKSQLTPAQAEPLPPDRQAGGVYKDVTAAEYGVLPKGAHYTKPGSDKVFVKQ